MLNYRSGGEVEVGPDAIAHYREQKQHIERTDRQDRVQVGWTFESKMGRETILLEQVEFRILDFLAARPYQAFTSERIAKAVTSVREPVSSKTVGQHINSLRRKLGFFADLVQTVPHIGYRYKA